MSSGQANRILLYAFFFLVFFIHYKTKLGTGTLHSWVLLLGCVITIPQIAQTCIDTDYTLPVDYTIIGVMALLLAVGSALNFQQVTMLSIQAYTVSLACYLFVRENMPGIPLRHFYTLNAVYLLINSVLMMLQFLTGDFFIAQHLAFYEPVNQLPSGVADGPTKNAMIHAAALSLVFAKVVFLRVPILSLDVLALLLGALSLLLTISRAGILGVGVAALVTILLAVRRRRPAAPTIRRDHPSAARQNRGGERARRMLPVMVVLFSAAAALYLSLLYLNANRVDSDVGRWTTRALFFKFAPTETATGSFADQSLRTRMATVRVAGYFLLHNPLQTLLGAGLGSFEEQIFEQTGPRVADVGNINIAEVSLHNSYLEVLIEGGLIVFCLFLYLIVHVVRKVLRRPDSAAVIPVLSGLVSTMVFMGFHDVIRGRMFWMPLGILGAVAYMKGAVDVGGALPARTVARPRGEVRDVAPAQ